jgi:small conductance mechanosensitive channel
MIIWFSSNSTWLLVVSALGLALLLIVRSFLQKHLPSRIPPKWKAQAHTIGNVIFWVAIIILLIVLILAAIDLQMQRDGQDNELTNSIVQQWILDHGIPIILTLFIAYLVYKVLKIFIPQLVERSIQMRGKGRTAHDELTKRARTLSDVFLSLLDVFIILVVVLTVLSELNINIAPLLASAGVAGVAISLGAQSLVKDFLSGFFILLEDQYNEGDVVTISGINGKVESVGFRRTIIRDANGVVHSIPNGQISTSSNFTREWSNINLNIPVSYNTDIDHAMEVINNIGIEMSKDKYFGKLIRSAPKALRLENFNDSSMEIKVTGETKASTQWEVAGELRKRIKKTFDTEGIEIPFPHIKLILGDNPRTAIECKECQHLNYPESIFCSNCGKPLDKK